MNWKLTNDGDVFVISDGQSRIHRVAENHSGAMEQQTPVAVRLRALFATAFPDRATCGYTLPLVVSFPPCADNEEAYVESLRVSIECPKGGVLTAEYDGVVITFPQAWRKNITWVTEGLSNVFTFNLEAVNPSVVSYVLDEGGVILEDEDGEPLEY